MRIFAFLAGLAGLAFLTSQGLIIGLQTIWTTRQDLMDEAFLFASASQLAFVLLSVVFFLVFAGTRRSA
ncbi:MAG: hypothetical protein PVI23_04310 [Maricaulaceae bacterium]|jgi:hypothetical protein